MGKTTCVVYVVCMWCQHATKKSVIITERKHCTERGQGCGVQGQVALFCELVEELHVWLSQVENGVCGRSGPK